MIEPYDAARAHISYDILFIILTIRLLSFNRMLAVSRSPSGVLPTPPLRALLPSSPPILRIPAIITAPRIRTASTVVMFSAASAASMKELATTSDAMRSLPRPPLLQECVTSPAFTIQTAVARVVFTIPASSAVSMKGPATIICAMMIRLPRPPLILSNKKECVACAAVVIQTANRVGTILASSVASIKELATTISATKNLLPHLPRRPGPAEMAVVVAASSHTAPTFSSVKAARPGTAVLRNLPSIFPRIFL